ncbi:MAG TPA: 16S rRNA (uracil(1498)-N(3))-methyltransferase [Desulfobacteria bacterium]|nr:16S rRNA (uracil(1498)-N(3))-methyltransferase [Desulfobacteria bacterium]
MARFFVSENSIENNTVTITGPDVKHISKVLRLDPGHYVSVLTGAGTEFEAVIREVTGKAVICDIVGEKNIVTEPPVKVTLYQGLPKGDKMELIIQKSTEIGVSRIVPMICERTVVKLDDKKASERRVRWQRVAEEAAKQSRRTAVPEVAEPIRFDMVARELKDEALAIMPWEEQKSGSIKHLLQSSLGKRDVAILIGPEGGFSPKEAEKAKEAGIQLVTLGPRIMRTETAGIVTAALVLYELGDLGGLNDG